MSLFNTVTLTLKRYTAGSYVNGEWVKGASTTQTITGTWQPSTGEDMQQIIGARRVSEIFKGYTTTPLRTVQPGTTAEQPDSIVKDGIEYEIVFVAPWNNGLIPHYKFVAVRNKEGV